MGPFDGPPDSDGPADEGAAVLRKAAQAHRFDSIWRNLCHVLRRRPLFRHFDQHSHSVPSAAPSQPERPAPPRGAVVQCPLYALRLTLLRSRSILAVSTLACAPLSAQSVDFDITEAITASLPRATVIELGDLDGDADLDAVAYSAPSGTIVYCENTISTTGGWEDPVIITTLAGTTQLQLFDGDNDGDLDIAAISPTALKLQYLENTGSLTFAGAVTVVDSASWDATGTVATSFAQAELVELGDLDGDTDLDAVSYSASTGNIVFFENTDGAGTWGAATTITNLPGATALQLFDGDNDGDLDVAAISPTQQELVYSQNTGPLTFAAAIVVADSSSSEPLVAPRGFVADDFDQDGVKDDFVIGDTQLLLYSQSFGNPVQIGLAGNTGLDMAFVSLASGDFDGTGGPDLAITAANYSGGCLLTLMNSGAPAWGIAARVDSGFGAVGKVVVANVDGLNRDDAVVCIPGEQRVGIYPDTGSGALETYPFYGDGRLYCDAGALDVAVVDLDGDSDLDVVISETGANTVSYSLNTGTTMSVRADASASTDARATVAAGDLDGDGDGDVLVGGINTVRLYQNELNLGFSVACAQPGGAITASGSDLAASNSVTLNLTGAQSGQLGYFINSYLGGNSPGAPISFGGAVRGQVCIGGTGVVFGRHARTAELFTTDGTGAASLTLDLMDIPNPRDGIASPGPGNNVTAILAGETWYWQAWYQVTGGSEFSDAIGIAFR